MKAQLGLAALLVLSACSTRPPSENPLAGGPSPSESWPGEVRQGKAVVRTIKGSATYSFGTNGWSSLTKGMILAPGTAVQTGRESMMDLYLGVNGPTLRVTPSTTVVLEKLKLSGSGQDVLTDTKLDLRSGRILGNARQLQPTSRYEIKTPTGFARTRGADFDISAKTNAAGVFESNYIAVSGELRGAETVNGVEKPWTTKGQTQPVAPSF